MDIPVALHRSHAPRHAAFASPGGTAAAPGCARWRPSCQGRNMLAKLVYNFHNLGYLWFIYIYIYMYVCMYIYIYTEIFGKLYEFTNLINWYTTMVYGWHIYRNHPDVEGFTSVSSLVNQMVYNFQNYGLWLIYLYLHGKCKL